MFLNIAWLLPVQFNGLCKWSLSAWVADPYITMSLHTEHAYASFLHKYPLLQNVHEILPFHWFLFLFIPYWLSNYKVHKIPLKGKKSIFTNSLCHLFKMENKVEDSYFCLNRDTERAPHEKMNCTCTRLNYGCNYFPVNIFMVLWFPARLTLLRWRGNTTVCSWRRRCGQAGCLWSRNTGRSRWSGLAVQGLKRSAPNCLQSTRPSWQR